jgi:NAD(P)-dependent dehydrogenase (short-subunit alcohol dehydrogenase family)
MARAEYRYDGEVVLVTGAGGGMGQAIAVGFALAGASVALLDVDEAGCAAAVAAAVKAGVDERRLLARRCDVSDAASVEACVGAAVSAFGGLDHAVNAAAIENESTALHELSVERFEQIQDVNVNGIFHCMRSEIGAMLATRGDGRACSIVNIASTNSVRPQPHQPAYTASKHAVIGITKAAAIDYAAMGIRVNAVLPGSIDTPMLRGAMERRGRDPKDVIARLSLIGRFGQPSEIADAAMWLCSTSSSFVTGAAVPVDAGYLAR